MPLQISPKAHPVPCTRTVGTRSSLGIKQLKRDDNQPPPFNLNKTKFVQFLTKSNQSTLDSIDLDDYHIGISQSTSFLRLILDSTLTWQLHIDKICTKLKTGCYILRSLKSCLLVDNLKMIYFSYNHSIITYGIIFWGNSASSDEVFKLQKKGH